MFWYIKMICSILILLLLTSCAFDHRKKVAYSLLYDRQGFEIDLVYAAAISAKFSQGTHVDELIEFTETNEGQCFDQKNNTITCEIPVRGHICAVRMIQITATLLNDLIQSTDYLAGGLGC